MTKARDLAVALETVAISVRARTVLSRVGLPGAIARFDLRPVEPDDAPPPTGSWSPGARHVARVAGRVLSTRPFKSTCLPTALTLAEVLGRHGLQCDMVIGVSASEGFAAHAWVELGEGRIDLSRYPLSAHREITRLRRRGAARLP